jgi:dolichol-phosphate mannosyltransferase
MDEGYDVVYGQRRRRTNETPVKLLTAALFYRSFRYLTGNLEMPVDTGDFRLMSRRIVDCFKQLRENQRFNRGLISWIGFKQAGVLYDREPRFAGETNMTMGKMLRLAMDAITGFSLVPLRFATQIGFIAFGLSIVLGVYAIVSWLCGGAIHGWFSLIASMIFFGSIQLFVLGIIGEYLGRVLVESKRRPLYFISDVTAEMHETVELVHAAE